MQCSQCGNESPNDAKFCPYCGVNLGGKKKKAKINGAAIAMLVLVVILPYEMEKQEDGFIWIYYSSGPASSSAEFICSVDPQTWEYKRIS